MTEERNLFNQLKEDLAWTADDERRMQEQIRKAEEKHNRAQEESGTRIGEERAKVGDISEHMADPDRVGEEPLLDKSWVEFNQQRPYTEIPDGDGNPRSRPWPVNRKVLINNGDGSFSQVDEDKVTDDMLVRSAVADRLGRPDVDNLRERAEVRSVRTLQTDPDIERLQRERYSIKRLLLGHEAEGNKGPEPGNIIVTPLGEDHGDGPTGDRELDYFLSQPLPKQGHEAKLRGIIFNTRWEDVPGGSWILARTLLEACGTSDTDLTAELRDHIEASRTSATITQKVDAIMDRLSDVIRPKEKEDEYKRTQEALDRLLADLTRAGGFGKATPEQLKTLAALTADMRDIEAETLPRPNDSAVHRLIEERLGAADTHHQEKTAPDRGDHPFFVRKAQEAKAFIDKHGLPDDWDTDGTPARPGEGGTKGTSKSLLDLEAADRAHPNIAPGKDGDRDYEQFLREERLITANLPPKGETVLNDEQLEALNLAGVIRGEEGNEPILGPFDQTTGKNIMARPMVKEIALPDPAGSMVGRYAYYIAPNADADTYTVHGRLEVTVNAGIPTWDLERQSWVTAAHSTPRYSPYHTITGYVDNEKVFEEQHWSVENLPENAEKAEEKLKELMEKAREKKWFPSAQDKLAHMGYRAAGGESPI